MHFNNSTQQINLIRFTANVYLSNPLILGVLVTNVIARCVNNQNVPSQDVPLIDCFDYLARGLYNQNYSLYCCIR